MGVRTTSNPEGPRRPVSIPTLATAADDSDGAELLFGRGERLRVFISSEMRSGQLRSERAHVASIVDRHPDADPWLWERHARAGRYSAFEVCVGTARTSDILLLILGDELTDVTEAEWRAAKDAGANTALLVKNLARRSRRAEAFIAAEQNDCIYVTFSGNSALGEAVQHALTQCMTDAVRNRALARRGRSWGHAPAQMHLLQAGMERAEQLLGTGALQAAREVLAEVEALVGGPSDWPEDLDLISGLVAGAAGNVSEAAAAYLRVIRNRRSSKRAVAIAYQNLGIEAMRAGQLRAAERYMKSALKRHTAADDWFGVLQVVLNLGGLSVDQEQAGTAEELSALAEELIRLFGRQVPTQQASLIGLRASIAVLGGRHREALEQFKKAHAISKRHGDHDGELVGCQNIAASYYDLGRFANARTWARKALELAGDGGATWRQEELHRLAGLIEYADGRPTEARRHFEDARALAARMGDSWRVATLTADIGAVLTELDDDEASKELDRARNLLEAEQESDWLIRVGLNRALIRERKGDSAEAQQILEELTELAQAGKPARIELHERLASLQLERGELAAAARSSQRALQLQPKNPESAVKVGAYAHQLQEAGGHQRALRLFDLALRRALKSDEPGLVYDARSDRALLLAAMGQQQDALSELEACLDLARGAGDSVRRVRALHNIGELARRTGESRRALAVLREACRVASRTGDDEAWRSAMGILGMTQRALGRIADAERTASKLGTESAAAQDRANEAAALGVLAGCAFDRKDYKRAAALYRAAARRNADDPVHHAEDLCGIVEAHAAADRWRPALRAAQSLVTYAQEHDVSNVAWPSLLSSARWYLDRGAVRRASTLTMPAWVLAAQSQSDESRARSFGPGDVPLEHSDFLLAMTTTAFHELWSGLAPCDVLYDQVLRAFDVADGDDALRSLIEQARQAARDVESSSDK